LVARGKTKSEEKGVKRKQIGLNLEKMKTCEGAGALTKEQGGTFCSTTFLLLTKKDSIFKRE
jgi:hypothetical protein